MFIKVLITISLALFIYAKEVSVFGAGDLNSKEPYGLTDLEKTTYSNIQEIKKLSKKLNQLKNSNTQLDQKIQGISSVYESDSENLNKNRNAISNITNTITVNTITIEKLKQLSIANSDSIITLEKRLDDFIIKEEHNLANITKLLNKINKYYVSKKQFDELVSFVNGNKKIKETKKQKKVITSKKLSNKEKFAQAISMVNKRYLTKSMPLWNELLKANYMPASSNYYMGEVRFGKKQYEKAIHHYKTSMILYDEAEYIPKLLLHSAISFEKINDKVNAINFYNTLIDVYSTTSEAKEARELIKKQK